MERRDFLKLASLAGLTVASGGAISKANAFDPKSKTLWLLIDAGGGWDPTSLCDPKGAIQTDFPNKYPVSAIKQRGNIRWAPMDASPDVQNNGIDVSPIDQFFETHYQDLLVLNGVDFAKGCYVGQEVVARLDTYHKVQRTMVSLHARHSLAAGDVLRAADVTARAGRRDASGRVTSAVADGQGVARMDADLLDLLTRARGRDPDAPVLLYLLSSLPNLL